MTSELTAALDRTKMPDREAVFTIAATATSLGHDINNLTLSVSTLRRVRRENRKKLSEKDKQEFNLNMTLFVHWDGKLLPGVTNFVHEKVDCLAILVMGEDTEKLLGVPKMSKGTGAAMTEATVACLVEWEIIMEQVIGCQFIYCIKVYMFRKQFKLTPKEEKGLLSFNLFAPLLYMKVYKMKK